MNTTGFKYPKKKYRRRADTRSNSRIGEKQMNDDVTLFKFDDYPCFFVEEHEYRKVQARIKELEEVLELYSRADIDVRKPSPNIYELFELDNGKYQPLGTKARKVLEKGVAYGQMSW